MKKIFAVSALALALGMSGAASAQMVSGGFQGPGLAPMSVADALKLNDDTAVVLDRTELKEASAMKNICSRTLPVRLRSKLTTKTGEA